MKKFLKKFNRLDLAILLGLAVFLTFAFLYSRREVFGSSKFMISFFAEDAMPFVADAIKIGDPIYQHGIGVFFGNVISIEVREINPERVDIIVSGVLELPENALNNGLLIGGNLYSIGQTVAFRAGDGILNSRVMALEKLE